MLPRLYTMFDIAWVCSLPRYGHGCAFVSHIKVVLTLLIHKLHAAAELLQPNLGAI